MSEIQQTAHHECIYQSGETVIQCGQYELVGGIVQGSQPDQLLRDTSIMLIHNGDIFPDFEGRSVCWHLAQVLEIHECMDTRQDAYATGIV